MLQILSSSSSTASSSSSSSSTSGPTPLAGDHVIWIANTSKTKMGSVGSLGMMDARCQSEASTKGMPNPNTAKAIAYRPDGENCKQTFSNTGTTVWVTTSTGYAVGLNGTYGSYLDIFNAPSGAWTNSPHRKYNGVSASTFYKAHGCDSQGSTDVPMYRHCSYYTYTGTNWGYLAQPGKITYGLEVQCGETTYQPISHWCAIKWTP